jgi:tRNA(adenine34) deaminase
MPSDQSRDRHFMRFALAEARKAARRGEVPVGAVAVAGDRVLGRAGNSVVALNDPTAHAEVVAIRRACRRRGNYRLPDCDLYVTLEPCGLCLGAVVQSRVKRLVYGAPDPKAGAVRSVMRFPFRRLNHRPEIRSGVLAAECAAVLKDFFRSRRKRAKS